MSRQTFFAPTDSTKKNELVDYLVQSGCEFIVKIKENHYRTKILSEKSLTSFSIYKFFSGSFTQQDVTCSFMYQESKYFFKSSLTNKGNELLLDVPIDIYQLQQRNDFRVDIPPNSGYLCQIVKVNSVKKKISADLRNLSLGGCQIALDVNDLVLMQNEQVTLKLQIKEFEAEDIQTMAKHIKNGETSNLVLVGLQFVDPQADFLTELQSLLMYLDRTHRGRQK